MRTKSVRYTFLRDSIYYLQFCLPDGKMFRRSLATDSAREANSLMIALMPSVLLVREGSLPTASLIQRLKMLTNARMLRRSGRILEDMETPAPLEKSHPERVQEPTGLSLGEAWNQYKQEKGRHWTAPIHAANDRYMEVMLFVLGEGRKVQNITKRDIKQVMEVVEGLPKRVVQPYRSMTIGQLIACDDVPDEQLLNSCA